jgi:hypothetical protein
MRSSTRRNWDTRFVHRACVYLHWAHAWLNEIPEAADSITLFEPIMVGLEECALGLLGEPIEYQPHPDTEIKPPCVRLRQATDFVEIAAVTLAGISARRRAVLPTEDLRTLLWQLRSISPLSHTIAS